VVYLPSIFDDSSKGRQLLVVAYLVYVDGALALMTESPDQEQKRMSSWLAVEVRSTDLSFARTSWVGRAL